MFTVDVKQQYNNNNLFIFFVSLCTVESSLLNQKTLRRGQTPYFRFLTEVRSSSYFPNDCWDLSAYLLICYIGHCPKCPIACVLFYKSAVNVHDSSAYRKREMMRKSTSFTFYPIDMLLSLQIGFSFVRTAMACTILWRTSDFELSSARTTPRYLK